MAAMGIQISPDGESKYEACHALYSYLLSSIYGKVTEQFTIPFYKKKPPIVPAIFCKNAKETHYKYVDASGKVHDPYESYQLYNTHGNCLFFALYMAIKDTYSGTLPKLYNVENLIENVTDEKHPNKNFFKVKPDSKQKAYKYFVHNDFEIFKWVFEVLKLHELPEFEAEWDTMTAKEKKDYGIQPGYTFDDYIEEFKSLMSIDESYKMTLAQVTNWDEQKARDVPDYMNSGIEGGVDEGDYKITGGKRKTRRVKKLK